MASRLRQAGGIERARAAALAMVAAALLASCGGGSGTAPPAPKRIALVYVNAAGRAILAPTGRRERALGRARQALLSPDGTTVATLAASAGGSTLTLYGTARAAAGARAVATIGPPDWSARGARLLAWSPDSRYIALSADAVSASGEESALVVVDVRSGRMTTIATAGSFLGASFAPTLPDRIVYSVATVVQLDENRALLYECAADGRHTRQLTRSGLASSPAWTARGILFARLLALGSRRASPRYGLWLLRNGARRAQRLGSFAAGAPASLAGAPVIVAAAGGRRAVADFYSQRSPGSLVQAWEIDLAPRRGPLARPLTLTGAVAAGISRDGKQILAVVYGAGGPKVEAVRWGATGATVLAGFATDPSWNH